MQINIKCEQHTLGCSRRPPVASGVRTRVVLRQELHHAARLAAVGHIAAQHVEDAGLQDCVRLPQVQLQGVEVAGWGVGWGLRSSQACEWGLQQLCMHPGESKGRRMLASMPERRVLCLV